MEKINIPENNSLNSLEGYEENVSQERVENLDKLRQRFPIIDRYLISSKKCYENNHVPIETGYYDNEMKEFTLEMEVHIENQAYEGIMHGGTEAFLIDSCGGMVCLIEAQKYGKFVITKKMKDIDYRLPLKVGDKIRIVGRIEENKKDSIVSSATIYKKVDDKELAFVRGTVEMKLRSETPQSQS